MDDWTNGLDCLMTELSFWRGVLAREIKATEWLEKMMANGGEGKPEEEKAKKSLIDKKTTTTEKEYDSCMPNWEEALGHLKKAKTKLDIPEEQRRRRLLPQLTLRNWAGTLDWWRLEWRASLLIASPEENEVFASLP